MTRVLVTGATGFLGRHVTPLLAAAGFDVHGVTSRGVGPQADCTWHKANLLDGSEREALVSAVKAEALLHLAWHAKPPAYWTAPENMQWVAASLDLFRLFDDNGGRRMVGAGSCAEYDWRQGYCSEAATPLLPSTLYGTAKAACGAVLNAYSTETGLSAAWGRLFFLFGPHDAPSRLVPSLVRSLAAGEPARCASGNHLRDFLHVADAAAALVALLQSPVTGAVNIGSGVPLRVGDIARRIADRIGRPDLLSIEDGPPEPSLVCANVGRLRDEVGWRTPTDVFNRLDESILWWLSPHAADAVS